MFPEWAAQLFLSAKLLENLTFFSISYLIQYEFWSCDEAV